MNKTIKIYVGLLIVLFIAIIAIELSTPPPVNWTPSYNETHKQPYGTFVLYNELESIFPESKVHDINVTPYEYFDDYYSWEDSTYLTKGTYMLIDNYSEIDEVSAQELLDFAWNGNDIFFSSNHIPDKFKEELYVETENDYDLKGEATFSFANPIFKSDSITIEKGLSNIYFSDLDSISTTVLGYQKFNATSRINFVKIAYGDGNLYLHLQPVVFTNYQLLKKLNKKYAEAVLSYLPDDTIFFDSRNKFGRELGNSPMRFFLSQPALRWAWYIALISLVLFMIFNAKRKQRIVAVINPLQNTTIAFTKTIGNLYYETKDHDNLIDKKITYFLEYIRRVFYLDTQILDEKFMKNLALKANKKEGETKKLINLIAHLKAKTNCNEHDLLRLSKAIEDFYNK